MAKKAAKAAPVEEVEDDEVELEELDADVEEDSKPAKSGRADDPAFGIRQLCDLIKSKTGKDYTPREVRTLLRKMARDGSGRVQREVTADNRSRYSWSGPTDPEVKAVLKAVGAGEIEAGKKEALDKLKQQKAAKAAQKADAPAKKSSKKKAAAPPPPDEDEEDEELDLDDDEE